MTVQASIHANCLMSNGFYLPIQIISLTSPLKKYQLLNASKVAQAAEWKEDVLKILAQELDSLRMKTWH